MSTSSPRQLRLLQFIPRAPRKITVEQLAERLTEDGVKVTTRTIRRDLEDLAEVHPIQRDGGKPEGWCFIKDAAPLLPPTLDEETALAFVTLEQFAAPLLPPKVLARIRPYVEHGRRVLEHSASKTLKTWLGKVRHLAPGLALLPAPIDPHVYDVVYDAVSLGRQFRVKYENAKKEIKEHVVSPLALVVRGPQRYVLGVSRKPNEPTQLALARMREAEVLDAEAASLAGFDLDAHVGSGGLDIPVAPGTIALKFAIRRTVGGFLFDTRISESQCVQARDDEWLVVDATVPNTRELRSFLLRYASDLEVLEPPEVRAEFAEIGRSLVKLHAESRSQERTGDR